MSGEIIVKNPGGEALIELSQGLINSRESALAKAKQVASITNADELKAATDALGEIKSLIKTVTAAHKDAKEPFLKITRRLDALKKDYAESLSGEEVRLSRLIGAHQEAERRKAEAARRAAEEEARRIAAVAAMKERNRLAEEKAHWDATGGTTGTLADDLQEIRQAAADQCTEAQMRAADAATLAGAGTTVRKVWEFECIDARALAAARPDLVVVTPNKAAIKSILKATNGAPIPGLRIWSETKASVKSAAKSLAEIDGNDY